MQKIEVNICSTYSVSLLTNGTCRSYWALRTLEKNERE